VGACVAPAKEGYPARAAGSAPAGRWAARAGRGDQYGETENGEKEARMTSGAETGGVTGTQDKDYNLIWYVESCLSNALRLETYIQDAERTKDTEVAELFRKAQADSRKGAELGKQLLRARLNGG
jgi:hypothetical protein